VELMPLRTTSPRTISRPVRPGGVPAEMAGSSVRFDGSTGYAWATLPSALKVPNLILAAWVRPNVIGGTQRLFSVEPRGANGTGLGILLSITSAGNVQLTKGPSGAFVNTSGTTVLKTNVWAHIAGSFDSATMKIWVNGVLDNGAGLASASAIGWTDAGSGFPVPATLFAGAFRDNAAGGNQVPNLGFANSQFSDLRYYNTALSATQMLQLAAGQFDDRSNLLAWWPCNERNGPVLTDVVAGYTLALAGGAYWSPDSPF
jgi:Concanavalin A-like lectin/glucanases superfamily